MAQDLNLNVLLKAIDKASGPLKDIKKGSGRTAQALKSSRDELKKLDAAQKNLKGFTQLKRSSQETAQRLGQQQAKVRELTRAIESSEAPSKRLLSQRKAAIRAARQLGERYDREQGQLQTLRRQIKNVDGVTGTLSEQQRELGRRVETTTRDIDRQKRALSATARKQRAAANAARQYARSQSRATRMMTAGAGGLATGGAALYGASRLLRPGIDYGEQVSELQAVLRLEKKSAQMAALNRQSRHLGATTQFTATDVAGGQTFLARAGFTPKAIHASIQSVLNEALVGGIELPRAADISSNIAGVFGVDIEKAGAMTRVVDTLTSASTHANVNIEMLGETMKYLGQASDLHVSMQQAAALAGILGNVGIQGSQAGTTLRQMMKKLTAPTKKGRNAIKELGLELADAQGNLRPIPDILDQISKATRGMGNIKRSRILSDLFEARAGSGVAALLNNLPALSQLLDDVGHSSGAAQKAASTMADNVGGDLKSLSSAWQEVGISITDVNDGPLRDLIGNITSVTRGIGNWIKANPHLASALSIAAGGLAAVVAIGGALVFVLGSILGPIALVRYALMSLNLAAALNPVTLALGLLAAAAVLIYANWGDIKQFFIDRWADIKAAFTGGTSDVLKLLLNWNPIGLIYRGITAALAALGVDIPKQFKTLGGAIVDGLIGGLTAKLGALKDTITGMGSATVGWLKNKLGIHSPSRVFAELGGYTVEGYRQGIAGEQSRAIAQIGRFGDQIRRAGAGAGLALAGSLGLGAAGPAAASPDAPIRFDNRAPIAATAAGGGLNVGGINITVNASAGMDESALAQMVEQRVEAALQRAAGRDAARQRSALYDTE